MIDRRSFLSVAGGALAGGALARVSMPGVSLMGDSGVSIIEMFLWDGDVYSCTVNSSAATERAVEFAGRSLDETRKSLIATLYANQIDACFAAVTNPEGKVTAFLSSCNLAETVGDAIELWKTTCLIDINVMFRNGIKRKGNTVTSLFGESRGMMLRSLLVSGTSAFIQPVNRLRVSQ